jgi:hypothetical protein
MLNAFPSGERNDIRTMKEVFMLMTPTNEIRSKAFRHCGHLMMLVSVPVARSRSHAAGRIGFSCICCGKIVPVRAQARPALQ